MFLPQRLLYKRETLIIIPIIRFMSIFQLRFQIFCLIKFLVVVIIIGRRLFDVVDALYSGCDCHHAHICLLVCICMRALLLYYCYYVHCCSYCVPHTHTHALPRWLCTHTYIDRKYKSVWKFSLICDLCQAYQLSLWHQRTHTHRKGYISLCAHITASVIPFTSFICMCVRFL